MHARSPSAVVASLALHLVVAAVLVALSLLIQRTQQAEKPPLVFELVAGAPTAPFEKEAPALGAPKLDVPKAVAPKPEPVVEAEEAEVAPPTPPPKAVTPPKTPAPPKAKEIPKPAPTTQPAKKMSYEDFKKKHGAPQASKAAAAPRTAKVPRIDAEGIAGGVRGGSKANTRGGGGGKALVRDDADEMTIYQAALKNRLKIAHDELKPSGLGDSVSAEVSFFVAANGEIGNVRITRSSGNAEFDQSVLAAFRRITWLGPRPDNRSDTWRLIFRMRELD
jgi:colicin import membrane protein